jgi:hypothetical protein
MAALNYKLMYVGIQGIGIGKGRAIGFNKRPWSLQPG